MTFKATITFEQDFCNSEEFCKSFGPGYLPCFFQCLLKSTSFSPLLSPNTITCMCCIPAFHDIEDSLASFGPGTGDFPSISNFDHDHSLQLPQFPSDDETDTHATPSVPPNLATIQESEEISTEDLLPLEDPTELEFGLNSEVISRHRSASHLVSVPPHQPAMRPHPLARYSASAPITGYADDSLLQGHGYQDERHRTPPPPYEDVISSLDIQAGSYEFAVQPKLDKEVRQRGVPRNSSTPFVNGQQ
jgi:hypothetical protein